MSKSKLFYTTSEYINALETAEGNVYQCYKKYFLFFSNRESADYDAQWFVEYWKKEGVKKRKPVVYRVKLEPVK